MALIRPVNQSNDQLSAWNQHDAMDSFYECANVVLIMWSHRSLDNNNTVCCGLPRQWAMLSLALWFLLVVVIGGDWQHVHVQGISPKLSVYIYSWPLFYHSVIHSNSWLPAVYVSNQCFPFGCHVWLCVLFCKSISFFRRLHMDIKRLPMLDCMPNILLLWRRFYIIEQCKKVDFKQHSLQINYRIVSIKYSMQYNRFHHLLLSTVWFAQPHISDAFCMDYYINARSFVHLLWMVLIFFFFVANIEHILL